MELFVQQVVAGLATGSIYACMALALVMIYQAIEHLNFAQGEMAMFSTFICWQLMQWGVPFWGAFVLTIAFAFAAGVFIERVILKPLHNAPVLSHVVTFIALYVIINSVAGFIWDFTVKPFPTPFGTAPLFGSNLIGAHQAGTIAVTLVMLSRGGRNTPLAGGPAHPVAGAAADGSAPNGAAPNGGPAKWSFAPDPSKASVNWPNQPPSVDGLRGSGNVAGLGGREPGLHAREGDRKGRFSRS